VLASFWDWRRSSAAALPQPREQWPVLTSRVSEFRGYAQNSLPFDPTEFRAHPEFGKRLTASSLTDPVRARWSTFD
jgi:hypothetical protein